MEIQSLQDGPIVEKHQFDCRVCDLTYSLLLFHLYYWCMVHFFLLPLMFRRKNETPMTTIVTRNENEKQKFEK